jgi:site-specific DNA-methyltransferase (adenine-specific)
MRKAKLLPRCTQRRAVLRSQEIDGFIFASEIAIQSLISDHQCTLDDVLCDPELAGQFDGFARRLAPGYEPFHYRWGALRLRKRGSENRKNMDKLPQLDRKRSFLRKRDIDSVIQTFRRGDRAGLYLLADASSAEHLYVGETLSFASRLGAHRTADAINAKGYRVSCLPIDDWCKRDVDDREALHAFMIRQYRPRLNIVDVESRRLSQV